MTESLCLEDLLAIEAEMGSPGIRDIGLLESALSRPQATVFGDDAYPSLAQKIGALVHSVITHRALVDGGNKRLGAYVLFVFPGLDDLGLWRPTTRRSTSSWRLPTARCKALRKSRRRSSLASGRAADAERRGARF